MYDPDAPHVVVQHGIRYMPPTTSERMVAALCGKRVTIPSQDQRPDSVLRCFDCRQIQEERGLHDAQ